MRKPSVISNSLGTMKKRIYMKHYAVLLCLLSFALPVRAAESSVDLGLSEITELGRLNGQALACSHFDAVAKIKALMIKHAPKSRRYGEAFETATNAAYIAQNKDDSAVCQEGSILAAQVEEAAKRLQADFPIIAPK